MSEELYDVTDSSELFKLAEALWTKAMKDPEFHQIARLTVKVTRARENLFLAAWKMGAPYAVGEMASNNLRIKGAEVEYQ